MGNPLPLDPLHNSGIPATPSVPGYGPENLPSGPAGSEKEFSLPGNKEGQTGKVEGHAPSPIELAGQNSSAAARLTPQQMTQHIENLQQNLSKVQGQLSDQKLTGQFTDDHYTAMKKVIDKMNPDLRSIANASGGTFESTDVTAKEPSGALRQVLQWINSSQSTLGGALQHLSNADGQQQNPADYLKMQMGIQRATQKGELFASIIGSSVSGIKTILSTQLG